MALLQLEVNKSLKRSSSNAGLDDPARTKLRRTQTYHHSLHYKSKIPVSHTSDFLDHAQSQDLFDRSIALALDAVGFQAVEPLALQSFRALAEEYMAHFLSSVHKSMLSSRRTESIPQDYLYALRAHRLSLRALKVHLDPPVHPTKSMISLELDAGSNEDSSFQTQDLNSYLEEYTRRPPGYLPKHFPRLPSSHTYKSTSKYTPRESDPRKIRERAIEEGRSGEAALQRFVSAGSKSSLVVAEEIPSKSNATLRHERFAAWKEAMVADDEDDGDGSNALDLLGGTADPREQRESLLRILHIGPIVNADQAFLQKTRGHAATQNYTKCKR